MKSSQSSDEVAQACGGFNSTENAVFDFIRESGLHHEVISSRQETSCLDFIEREKICRPANAIKSTSGGINLLRR